MSRSIDAIGIIVPAHNEQDLLPSCLASVRRAAQALPGTPVHLVVAADALTRPPRRRTGHLDPASVWLSTTDADTLVPVRWLSQQARYAGQGWDAIVGTIQVADWSGHTAQTRSLFRKRYEHGQPCDPHEPSHTRADQHPHVHGANLGFRASAYLRVGGFPALPTAEDHALVEALAAGGCRVLRTRALPVVTSARRDSRAPDGFGHYLRKLEAAQRELRSGHPGRLSTATAAGPG